MWKVPVSPVIPWVMTLVFELTRMLTSRFRSVLLHRHRARHHVEIGRLRRPGSKVSRIAPCRPDPRPFVVLRLARRHADRGVDRRDQLGDRHVGSDRAQDVAERMGLPVRRADDQQDDDIVASEDRRRVPPSARRSSLRPAALDRASGRRRPDRSAGRDTPPRPRRSPPASQASAEAAAPAAPPVRSRRAAPPSRQG